MAIESKRQEDIYKITIIAVLLAGACFSTYYFHAIVQTSTVFTHYFYIPIILASLWWKRKGLVVALFLAALLILSHIFFRSETEIAYDLIRTLFFIVISLGVATLSEQITKTEGLLRESRDYLEKLINCANAPIILWDTAFKIKRANHGFEHLTGYSANELIDQEIYMLLPVTIRDELLGKIERTISGSDLNSVEIPILCKNGDIRTSLWSSANILTKDGATHLVTIAQGIDITERMQADEEQRKTKEYLDNIIESSLDCILVTDRKGHITIANKAFLNLLDHTSEEIIGKHTVELSPTEEGTYKSTTGESVEIGKEFFDSTKAIIQGKFFKEDKISNWETYLIRKDRVVIPVEENLVYLNDDQGNRIGAVGIIRDITERKQIAKNLQESEERLRTLVSNIPGAVYRCDCDPDWTMRFLSEAILEISGYPASDFINNEVQTYASIIHPDDRSFVEKVVFEATEQKRPYIIEYRIVNANGSVRWVYEKGQGVFGKNNEVLWLDGAIFDNTDRKKTEEDKTKIEGRLENKVTELSIMNEISEVLLSTRELDEILHMILIGATAYQALGFNRAFLFLINEEEIMLEGKVATGSLAIEEAYKIWERLARESHTLKELLKSRYGELSKEDEPINNLVKKMKIPLREGENIFTQAVYENKSFNIKDGTDNPLIDKNFTSLLGTDTFALVPLVSRGKPLGVLLADNFINKKPIVDEDVERLGAFANHASLAIENSHLYKSSREKVEELSRAYNELQENRDKLLRYERLSAVGNVAARVTHEIRNPLVAIGGFARRILRKDQDGEANRNYVKIIVEEIDRLENTLTDILSFTKPALPKCDTVDLNEIIKNILKVLDFELTKSNIRTEEHFDPALPILWLDENQIRRVVINLIRNAIQAMPDGGTIIISTTREDQWVRVETADTGVGISDEDINKLFDAFFTSKSTGSGLGLTVSAQIINNHGGTIEVQKREPQGTLFIIRLPIKKPSALT